MERPDLLVAAAEVFLECVVVGDSILNIVFDELDECLMKC